MERKIRKQQRTWRLLISSFILLSATGFALADDLTKFSYYRSLPNGDTTYKQGELIVHFADVKPGVQPKDGPMIVGPLTKRAVKDTISNFIISGSSVAKEYEHIMPGLALIKLPEDVPTVYAFTRFNRSANVLYAEPNYKFKLFIIPDDPRFPEQWGLNNFGQFGGNYDADIDAPEAWDIRTDSNVVVAVIDTGIDYAHPDLRENMWINPGEVNDPCVVTPADFNDVDDDDNEYVDDIYGYDFVDNDSDPCDENYHGTHVAGIIGAVGNNDEGVAGVCWRVKLMALRAFDAAGEGLEGDIIEAIDYATKSMRVSVINASWGNYDYSNVLYNIIADADAAGILFVAAAGNDGYSSAAYPAAYGLDNIISVMATNDLDNMSAFSNYGYNVDLGAPGEDIISTTPMEETDAMTNLGVAAEYDYLSGTSMAAPHVSGACALLKAENPTMTYRKIKALIFHGVDPVLPGLCLTGGRLNLFRSLNMAQTGTVINTRFPLIPFPSIQQAIDYPNTVNGDTLVAAQGYWYFETINFKGKKILLRSGDLYAPSYGPLRPDITYISAFVDKYFAPYGYFVPVTFNHGEDNGTDMAGFTVIDGDNGIECRNNSSPEISDCNITRNEDRGIYCLNSSPAISYCNITNNESSGIYCNNSDPNISDCTITMNTSQGSGGGIYCDYGSNPSVNNCLITQNISAGQGGGIYAVGGSNPYIRNCTIFENEADWEGGGIYFNNVSPTITDSNITGCISHWDGGGIYCDNGANPNIKNCTINNNMAYFDGGAIYCNGSSPLIKNCLIIDNTVDSWDCGGIFCWDASPTITNCTLAGNSSNEFDGLGGAMFCLGTSKPVITNCIFSDNNDIAIYEYELASDPNIRFSLFYNNPDGDYYDKDSGAHGNLDRADPTNFLATMRHYNSGDVRDSNNIGGNPMFVLGRLGNYYLSQFVAGQILDANGAPVDPNVNPQDATSPAVDAGSAAANVLGMNIYSTRTDNVADSGKVDIGFHYNDPEPSVMYYLSTYATNGTISPASGYYIQYKQVLLKGAPADPNYQLKYWSGTDNDSSKELRNIVTMDSDRYVRVVFETILVYLRCRVVEGNGTLVPISPEPVEIVRGRYYIYHRGTVVNLAATPANPEQRARWGGDVDDEFSSLRTNTVTMTNGPYPIKDFTIDTQGKDCKIVEVEFYLPRIFNVPGDYTNIHSAINAAQDGDIVMLAPGVYDIFETQVVEPPSPVIGTGNEIEFIYINDKAITITSVNPDDPCVVASTVITGGRIVMENVNRGTVIDGITIRDIYSWSYENAGPGGVWWMETGTGSGVDSVPGLPTMGGGMMLGGSWSWHDPRWYGLPTYWLGTASPTIKNCVFLNCSAHGLWTENANGGADELGYGGQGAPGGKALGGAVYCGPDSRPIFINCSFTNCFAQGGDGSDAGSNPPGHGGGWGDPEAEWYWEWGPFEDFWKYSGYGGAAYCDIGSTPEFVNCTFTNNYTVGGCSGISGNDPPYGWPERHYKIDSFGGAVYAAASSSPKFTDCTFTNNEADVSGTNWHGGGGDEVQSTMEDPYIGYGGAIAFEDGANPTFINCTFNDNLAAIGGGMWATWADTNIVDCNFTQNAALHGGGVYFIGGSPKITQNNFRENEALYDTSIIDPNNFDIIYGEGGAIYCFDGNALIANCNIFNNLAGGSGGGIYISGSAKPLVKNCLITGNSANRDGGGISANWHSKPNISNCTITGNMVTGDGFESGYGGGLYCSYNSYVNIINSIVWENMVNIGCQGSQLAIATDFTYDPILSTVNVTYSDIQNATDPNAFSARREALDLVFCIDTTGSMDDDIAAVKAAAREITSAISDKIPDFRIAVIDYKDFNQPNPDPTLGWYGGPTDYPYRTDLEFTTDTNEVINALNSLSASGGADTPESVYTALMHCIDHTSLEETLAGELYGADPDSKGPGSWRPGNVLRVIILMGDAQPHDPEPFTNYTLGDVTAAALREEPKRIIPLLIGGDPNAASYFGSLASGTGGIVMQAAAASEVVNALMQAIDLISQIPDPISIGDNCVFNWDPDSHSWDPNSYNIDADPYFIAGYYLSQIAAGQSVNSPCVDSGSANANAPSIDLDTHTTRTDSFPDTYDPNNPDPNSVIVDMGYHYSPFTAPKYKLTFKVKDVNDPNWPVPVIIEPNIHDPNYDGYFNWYTTVPLRIESTYDANIYQVLWSGTDNDSLTGPTNTVTMNSNKTVTVRLVKSKYELSIEVDGGNGQLSAEWSEDGNSYTIEAPQTENIELDTVVKLIAKPNEGYRVKRWNGTDNDSSRSPTNTVTINSNRTVRVKFGRPVTITVPGNYPTIQEAISAAEEGDTIVVYGGTYEGDINLQGKEITVVSANPDDPNVVAATIIDCNENGRGFIFNSGENANTIINGFTIIDGNVFNGIDGGGIFIDSGSSPTIMNTVISDCNAMGDPNNQGLGGGIYINSNSSPSFINCTITYCSADGGGGAFCNLNSSPTFRHCTFSNDLADWGGGLLCGNNSSTTIIDCNFVNNEANRGGGLYGEPNSLVTIDGSTFTDNTAAVYGGAIFWFGTMEIFDTNFVNNSARHGGGMFCSYSAETTIVGCTLMQNRAGPVFDPNNPNDPNASIDGRGGGIFCFAAPALIRDCIINHNVATTSGGAIYLAGSSNSPQLLNCLITDNLAGRDGGGISINWYAEPLISNCTFVGNAAVGTFGEAGSTGFGGGLYCSYGSDSEVIDSIFWNNYALRGSEIAVATGFEFDPRPSTLTITYSDIKTGPLTIWVENGCTLVGWNQLSNTWNPNTHNINSNPLFVTGLVGDYYLSQTTAGQSQNSPCVNSGSDLASNLGMVISPFDMARYTTRTDSEFDKGTVDMGYHYHATIEVCRYCDLFYDGFIDFKDFAIFTMQWLNEGCSDDNNWCQGADITYNTVVDFDDLINFLDCWLAKDNLAPIPNPSEWKTEPYLISTTSIGMSAKTSFDTWGWGVGYFFKCAYGNCHDSGWQSSPTYTDSGLAPVAIYGYMVKSRDALGNETGWSDIRYAGQEDSTPPAPVPYINTIEALGSNSVTMTATTAYDESGVEYYFDCNTAGGHDSSWQSSPTYIDTDLAPDTTYYYRVKARDNSPANNETAWSNWVWVTTTSPLDNLPPQPDPMAWDPTEDANGYDGEPRLINIGGGTFDWYATMRATEATDVAPPGVEPSGVEYKFVCVTSGKSALSSPWQTGLSYTVQVGGKFVVTDWYVIARDTSTNHNTTAASSVVRALPPL